MQCKTILDCLEQYYVYLIAYLTMLHRVAYLTMLHRVTQVIHNITHKHITHSYEHTFT